jgi:DNA-binding LacI/PurR family transcriptional regulator
VTATRPRRGAAPTLEDVAAHAGVSRATASRVVTGTGRVAASTRQAVEAAVDALGYAPHQAARNLAASSSDTVALVVCEPSGRVFGDPFFGRVVRGVAGRLGPTRYQLGVLMVQDDAERPRVERHLVRGNAAGALLVSTRQDDPLPAALVAAGVPCVLAGRPADGVRAGWVDADNTGGARRAVGHLLGRGRRVVATVAGPPDMAVGADRLAGWRDALAAAGRPAGDDLVEAAPFTREGGRAAAGALLDRRPDVDAVFAASDTLALGVYDALRARGRRVPDDVAVVGFDDDPVAAAADPPLTTVAQPVEELGRRLAGELLAEVEGRSTGPPAIVLATELVVRASS